MSAEIQVITTYQRSRIGTERGTNQSTLGKPPVRPGDPDIKHSHSDAFIDSFSYCAVLLDLVSKLIPP